MKLTYPFQLLLIVFLLVQCSKNDSPITAPITGENPDQIMAPKKPETYFTVHTFENFHTDETEDWLIIHDQEGKLLDYRSFESGDQIEFTAVLDTITDFITLSHLTVRRSDESTHHDVFTEVNIPIGSERNYGTANNPPYVSPVFTDEFEVSINDIPVATGTAHPPKLLITSKLGRTVGGGRGQASNNMLKLTTQVSNFEGADSYIITILDAYNNLKYHEFENPLVENQNFNFQTDFVEFDSYILVDLPVHTFFFLNVAGFEDDQDFHQNKGYWLHDVISAIDGEVNTKPLKIGYLDRFSKYRTVFNIQMPGYDYFNTYYGAGLSSIDIPQKPDFSIVDPSFSSFKFDVNIDYKNVRHLWKYTEGTFDTGDYSSTRWYVDAEKGATVSMGSIPGEILEIFPTIGAGDLEYSETTLNLEAQESDYYAAEGITVYK